MTPTIIVAIFGVWLAFIGGVGSFMILMWRIGRWQASAEGRSDMFIQRFDGIDQRLDRINGNLTDAHRRIDTHLAAPYTHESR